jgi:subtilase family serine protease
MLTTDSNRRFKTCWAGPVAAGFLLFALTGSLYAQARQRIIQPVDNQALVRIHGTVHPLATAANDRGRVTAALAMDRMLLVLKSSAEQETAMEQLLAEQQDPASPHYHQWLTPQQFGEQFGASQQDLDVITNWLQDSGFRVNSVAEGRRTIEFSGTARQVEEAFQTEIHHYEVNGERHVANATDIAIPEALAPVVGGIVSLHDFPVRPLYHRVAAPVSEGARPGSLSPAYNTSSGVHAIGPYDFATIYDVAPLWNLKFDGTGQTIAIPGHTNIKLTDVTAFRSYFGLPVNNPTIIVNGTDPGIISAAEQIEADLDVEWSGAVAKGATIKFVVSKSTSSTDGIDLSGTYIVNNNLASVMSLSFGACETQLGTTRNQFYNSLWSQAAAEGISVFVAAGDTGSAGCDIPVSYGSSGNNTTVPASHGLAVNGLASTPYNAAVGGTEFSEGSGTYWNTSMDADNSSAKSYIPEVVWQESSYTTAGASGNSLYAGGGGVSSLYANPSWQTGVGVPTVDPGTTSGHHRYLPDVSLSAAGHDGYVVEQEGSLYLVGGTSASSPSFAGIMAIVDQYTGARNGNPNSRLYTLASQAPTVFHDVTSGTNAVPCAGGSSGCSAAAPSTNIGHMTGYSAGAGYDLTTGLGSVDAYDLASYWSTVTPAPAITSMSPNPMTGSSSNQTLIITGTGFLAGSKVVFGCTGVTIGTVTLTGSTQIQVPVNVGTTARSCTVQVVNLAGQASNSVTLTVNAPPTPPTITTLSPNPMTGSSSNQTLTITGTGFVAGLKVTLGNCTGATVGTITLSGSTQIQVPVNVGTTTRTCTVQVTNSNGQASNTVNLQVNAPPVPPAITSLSPNPMTGSSSSQTLTITGTGFLAGPKVTLGCASATVGTVTLTGSTQIQVPVNVGATARTCTVQVTNSNGQASNTVSLTVSAAKTK